MIQIFTEEELTTFRTCRTCGIKKHLSEFLRFHNDHEPWCKDCRNGRPNTYTGVPTPQGKRRFPPEPIKEPSKEKFCKTCRTWKPQEQFKKDKRSFDGLSSTCLDCFLKNIRKTPEQKKNTTQTRLYHTLPIVVGARTPRSVKTLCHSCKSEIITTIRPHPKSRYQIECPTCQEQMIMAVS